MPMKQSQRVLLIAMFVVVGLVSYKFGQRSVPAANQVEEKLKSDLVELTQKDFEEYQNLKSLEDRYKKADEILGKIVSVFLADIGVRLSFKPTNPALLDVSCNTPLVAASPTPSPAPVMSQVTPTPTPNATPKAKKKNIRLSEGNKAFQEELRSLALTDLFAAVKESSSLKMANAANLMGHFQGEIRFFDRKKHKSDWILEWSLAKGGFQETVGISYIKISNKSDGNLISKTDSASGQELLKNYFSMGNDGAIFVNIYSDRGYVQIYPQGSRRQWAGNYYERESLGVYSFAGQVQLSRLE